MPPDTGRSGRGPLPLLDRADWDEASVFRPENLLREARRQRILPLRSMPAVVVLDPDGDLARYVVMARAAAAEPGWACYHTTMLSWRPPGCGQAMGVIAHTVGAPFAVLVAEQLFASGCQLVVNLTSAGQLAETVPPPYFVLIDRALRDEGTSFHYAPPDEYADADPALIRALWPTLASAAGTLLRGASWTTDAPYRETASALARNRARGLLLVEMEAAGLYAFARARGHSVLCIAHVTNRMAQEEGDFEKGESAGAPAALRLVEAAAVAWAAGKRGLLPRHAAAREPSRREPDEIGLEPRG